MSKRKPTKAVPNFSARPLAERPQPVVDLIMAARLARRLGVSPVTFWRWRKMPGFPVGRRLCNHVYYSVSEVMAWIDGQQQAA
jgi:predicted DNA-binding transcriptional regulator AlpA